MRREWAKKFRTRGIDSAELDARILVGGALGLDRAALAAADGRRLGRDEEAVIAALAERRLAHEPVARIVGWKEFWSLALRVDASTLVPRPETETVVEAALTAIDAAGPRTRPLRIADLGTGSGAILLALLSELPNASGVGTDVSVAALFVARENARRLRTGPRAVPGLRHGGGATWPIRHHRLKSALYRLPRNCRTRSGRARFRPAPRARRRV